MLIGLVLGRGSMGSGGSIREHERSCVRPLFDVARKEVEGFCRALHLRPLRDPTNEDPRLLRNATRLEAIPTMERDTGRGEADLGSHGG